MPRIGSDFVSANLEPIDRHPPDADIGVSGVVDDLAVDDRGVGLGDVHDAVTIGADRANVRIHDVVIALYSPAMATHLDGANVVRDVAAMNTDGGLARDFFLEPNHVERANGAVSSEQDGRAATSINKVVTNYEAPAEAPGHVLRGGLGAERKLIGGDAGTKVVVKDRIVFQYVRLAAAIHVHLEILHDEVRICLRQAIVCQEHVLPHSTPAAQHDHAW